MRLKNRDGINHIVSQLSRVHLLLQFFELIEVMILATWCYSQDGIENNGEKWNMFQSALVTRS